MDVLESVLSEIDGGKVLDVATLQGRFAHVMKGSLRSYSEIVGIDINERAIEAARVGAEAENLSFLVMDAETLEFDDEHFDTVSISGSLHHLASVRGVLEEMKRVLRPGGRFIVVEMYRADLTEPEQTASDLHQWAADVDTALGRLHNHVFTREEILGHLESLGLREVESRELRDTESDPMDDDSIERVKKVIVMVGERAKGAGDDGELGQRGQQLLERLLEVGIRSEPALVITGVK